MAWSYALYFILLISFFTCFHAQTISTSTPVPPLQWLNISALLNGPSPPPLKDSTIAYDETTRSLVIFGGESEGGFVQSQTYLLNLNTLTWSVPMPPATLMSTPAARSSALGGDDIAASNRHGFVVIGGKGSDGMPLSDVWEYDFINQFWSEVMLSPGGPSARWGASGGIDIRTAPRQDPVIPGPNNTFYLAGGFNGSASFSDIWTLSLSGTLSSNMPNTSMGSWTNISFGSFPAKVGQAGTVLQQQIIMADGCNTTNLSGNSCAQQDSHIINTAMRVQNAPAPCPAPRLSASLVPNLNALSPSFTSQVFLLLGTFNTSLWQDDDGLQNGEVAVLDTNTGSWSRILPAGDPGTPGSKKHTFPTPREGAAAFAYSSALVGDSRSSSADTIIFGGRDASGKYLSEVWLLRAYNGAITDSNSTWSGFGNGELQTGIDANGAGVTVQYMSTCATAIGASSSSDPSAPLSSPSAVAHPFPFDTSISHKLFSTLSIAFLLPAVIVFRLASPSYNSKQPTKHELFLVNAAVITIIVAYGLGVAGLATAFTTITSSKMVVPRAVESHAEGTTLRTLHGKAGLALFVGLYISIPLLLLPAYICRSHDIPEGERNEKAAEMRPRTMSSDTTEILSPHERTRSASESTSVPSRTPSPRARLPSWGPSNFWRRSHEGRLSSDSESAPPTAAPGFEVLNRPIRTRTTTNSTTLLNVPVTDQQQQAFLPVSSASLRNVDWLRRRRILNAVGDLDYTLTQAHRTRRPETPDEAAAFSSPVMLTSLHSQMPPPSEVVLRLVFHALLLGACVLSLVALWSRASRPVFAVFLAWTLCFYLSIPIFAWRGKPRKSIIAVMIGRLRTPIVNTLPPDSQPPTTAGGDTIPFPTASTGPYVHRPPFRAANSPGQDDALPSGPRSVESDDEDEDDEDEDTRQRRIEDEMDRREVSIVTVPKRKLLIANPS